MDAQGMAQIENLYKEMYPQLLVYANCGLKSPSLAEEAVQETFCIACQKAKDVLCSKNPQGWIFQTLKYSIQNIKHKQLSARRLLERYILVQSDKIEYLDDRICLDVMFSNVSDMEEFRLLKEFAIDKKSHEELAAQRNISVSACKKRVQRAKETLKKF